MKRRIGKFFSSAKKFDGRLAPEQFSAGSRVCLENSKRLLVDAELMYEKQRFAGSYALAITSIEEAGKAYLLLAASRTELSSEQIKIFWGFFYDHNLKVASAFYPGANKKFNEIENEDLDKSTRAFLKFLYAGLIFASGDALPAERELSLYVSFDEKSSSWKSPESVSEEAVKKMIEFAKEVVVDFKEDAKGLGGVLLEFFELAENKKMEISSNA